MHNVGIDNTVEDVAANEAKITIDSSKSSGHESPSFTIIMRDVLVRMVKIGNSN